MATFERKKVAYVASFMVAGIEKSVISTEEGDGNDIYEPDSNT